MKRTIPTLTLILLAGQAAAHSTGDMHSHAAQSGGWALALTTLALITAAAIGVYKTIKVRP
ncbi:MAG: hypothetical protein ACWA40_02570 [Planktomarina sp.]